MTDFAVEDLSERECARLVKSAVTPRPIAWISTRSADGADNLAPFSSYNYVGSHRPVLVFNSPLDGDGPRKHTARNALDTGEFAVNVVTADLLERMDATSAAVPPGESEFEVVGVERAPCTTIEAPRVAEAPVTMECTLYDALEVRGRQMVLGDVEHVHVDDSVLVDGAVDARRLDTVGVIGGPYYTVSAPVEFTRGR